MLYLRSLEYDCLHDNFDKCQLELIMFIVNYEAPKIVTLPVLSMPPIEHIYSGGESANKPEIELSKGIEEIETMIKHNGRQEIYSIQQSVLPTVFWATP